MQRTVRSYGAPGWEGLSIYYRQQAPLELNAITFNIKLVEERGSHQFDYTTLNKEWTIL